MYNFSKADIESAIEQTKSMSAAAKLLGVKYDTFKKYAEKFEVFEANQAGKGILRGSKYKTKSDVFKSDNRVANQVLAKWLKLERKWCCEECGISEWNDKPLTLEVDHIDGDGSNNELTNLKILCPNCHSQTPTWRGRNLTGKKRESKKVSDEDLVSAIIESSNVKEALTKVGLVPKGGNYNRVYKLISDLNLGIEK